MLDEPCKNSLAKDIKDFLTENLSNTSITMDTITSKFPYSKDHLRRIFKNEYYMTPMEMLDSLRLSHAKELLEQMPMYNISQISELCGFTDPLYFSRFFKKHTHVSPKKYKSQFK